MHTPALCTVRVLASVMVMFAITAGLASAAEQRVQEVKYSSVEVHGIKVFYREAGPADGAPILLLHGFPASSHMFRLPQQSATVLKMAGVSARAAAAHARGMGQ
jgi:hypothetical protein